MKTVVLGAGIAGLAYLYNANIEDEVYVYEKESTVGGLCRSFTIDGFVFDSAVHLSFATDKEVRRVFDAQKYNIHIPVSYNFFKDRWIKHPIINNIHPLTLKDKYTLIKSYLKRDSTMAVNNYEDWLLASYGTEFAERFFSLYTKKYWTLEPKEMSIAWIGERLAKTDLKKIIRGALWKQKRNDYYAKEMRYPQYGGYETFLKELKNTEKIKTRKKVVAIDTYKKEVSFEDESVVKYDRLVSSLPLCEMVYLVKNTPDKIKSVADRLKYTKVSVVSVGFNKPDIAKYLWMYIYDKDIWASRVNSPSIKSINNAPNGCSSLQFEIYHDNNKIISENEIIENVKYALKKMKICAEEDILFMDYRVLPYGNVIFYNGMERDREIVRGYMESVGIAMIGRFGEWDYLWSDQSFMSGYSMAKKHSQMEE